MIETVLLDIGTRLPLGELWGTAEGFVILMVVSITAIGVVSRSLTVGAFGGYLTFVYYAIESELSVMQPPLYATLVLVILGAVFKTWKLEGFES